MITRIAKEVTRCKALLREIKPRLGKRGLSAGQCAEIWHCAQGTASNRLVALQDIGMIRRTGHTKGTRYFIRKWE